MKAEVLNATVEFVDRPFLAPLILSSGAITTLPEAVAEVVVRVDGREATGRGSVYLSDLWAWPDPALTHEQRDAELRGVCLRIAGDLKSLCGGERAHPLKMGLRLHDNVCREATPPPLARAMCASPFDAAIHDAAGIALGVSAFDFYTDPSVELPLAGACFAGDARAAIAEVISKAGRTLRAWYVVGKNDTEQDLAPWVRDRGYHCFKIKLMGGDNNYDVARTIEVFRIAGRLGAKDIELSLDTNEGNPDAASVLDFLDRLRAEDAETFAAVQYLEQPTARDISANGFDWRDVTALKPVLLDEGLTSLERMEEALGQGWSGFALKTCKGHSFSLVAAAWARRHNLLISMADLTNPGLSMIHAALFAAHVRTINGAELNSPQFTPAANEAWLPRLAGLFDPTGGVHRLPDEIPAGLGSGI